MLLRKNIIAVVLVLLAVIFGAATQPQQQQPPQQQPQAPVAYKNLKVLPKNITKAELDTTMRRFRAALGVRCNFCHAQSATNPQQMDFPSDAKPEKTTARGMIKMAMAINKKYFHQKGNLKNLGALRVSCKTCHNGKEKPEKLKI
ncbi:MAG TPA: c-type cytochrome [Sphingobacteriaceae bacterium]|nr:c-type cytochrome [Sphingobacteriaceae bacterium]